MAEVKDIALFLQSIIFCNVNAQATKIALYAVLYLTVQIKWHEPDCIE
jgi:hypothetical protein